MPQVVLLRHGESVWNRDDRFTGWTDVDLSERGKIEAAAAAETLRAEGFTFDVGFSSVLKRTIRTLWTVIDGLDRVWIPVHHSWRLNERHNGALQGLNKAETARRYGYRQALMWRRGYDTPPPPLEESDPRYPGFDPRYAHLSKADVPRTECLKDVVARVLPYWSESIVPAVRRGDRVIVVAHGNSLRALVKYLDGLSDDDVVALGVPTGIPLVYDLDDDLRPLGRRYLGAPEDVARRVAAVTARLDGP